MVEEQQGGIRDFDIIVPKERLARIGGEVVNVATIPTRVALGLARFADTKNQEDSGEMFEGVIKLISLACIKSNPKVTPEFLMDNTTFESVSAFIEFVLNPVQEKAKNLTAVKLE